METSLPLTPAQVRAARATLQWSIVDLSRAARVSVSVVKRVEDGQDGMMEAALAAIQDALEAEGVRFLAEDRDGPGLRFKRR